MTEDEKFIRELTGALKNSTEEATDLKEETWKNIRSELFPTQIKKRPFTWRKGILAACSGIAVMTIIFFALVTDMFTDEIKMNPNQDSNDIDEVKDLPAQDNDTKQDHKETEKQQLLEERFPKEKQAEIEMEGDKYPITVHLATNEELRYIIYYDKAFYKFVSEAGIDRIVSISDDHELDVPEVAMEIKYISEQTETKVIENIKNGLNKEGFFILREEKVETPIDGYMIEAIQDENGGVWNTAVHRYYIKSNKDGSLFVFKQMFFVEAFEGHAIRFNQMLESFQQIVD
ncbi:hypothetical protein ACFFIS_10385 [Virgibacillus soli]|uniref:DUF4367 domain-containing protein n=1 Tax=Paracerasibacillus soli TaxID=480284 RepID=A0ABU5CMA6_9BACI|nr:hypothetical protein [Virgibacillus soli]MDY0407475.1 hypothetical protein [Virgibacillus soli]